MAWVLKDYNNTGDNSASAAYGVNWSAQTFTTVGSYTITKVRIKAYRVGSPGTLTLSIRATSGGNPTGADLCSGTANGDTFTTDTGGDWYEVTLGAGSALTNAVQYAIVTRYLTGDASNYGVWRNYNAAGGNYAGGAVRTSADSGATWTASNNRDMMFETYSGAAGSYTDIAATIPVAVGLTGGLVTNPYRNLAATVAIVVSLSGAMQMTRTGTGMLSRASKVKPRLIAVGNNCLYYEDVD